MLIRKGFSLLLLSLLLSVVLGERPLNSMLSPYSPFYKYLNDNQTSLFSYENVAKVLKSKAFEES